MKAEQLSQNQSTPILPPQSAFSSKKIFREALRFWYLYLVFLFICVGYAWFTVHYATPMYKVYGQVLVQNDKNGGTSASALSGNGMDFSSLFGGNVNMQNEIAILQTTDLCRKVVDAQQLNIAYYDEGDIRKVELYDGSPFQLIYIPDNGVVHPVIMRLSFEEQPANHFLITVGKKIFQVVSLIL